MDVSIIIVSYNNFDLLENCINSLLKFTKNYSFEIIVIDNNSSEGNLPDILDKYYDIILIQNKSNAGFGAANNQGLAIAKGKYVLFLNNDTEFFEDSISILFEYFEESSIKMISGCKLLNSDYSNQNSVVDFDSITNLLGEAFFIDKILRNSKYFNKYHYNYKKIKEPTVVDFIAGAFIFGKLKYFKDMAGFDERFYFYAEEVDLCYRFSNHYKGKVLYFPNTSIIHLHGATTKHIPWFKYFNQAKAKIQFYQKHFRGIYFVLIILLHYLILFNRFLVYLLGGLITFNKNLIIKSYFYFKLFFVYPKNVFKK